MAERPSDPVQPPPAAHDAHRPRLLLPVHDVLQFGEASLDDADILDRAATVATTFWRIPPTIPASKLIDRPGRYGLAKQGGVFGYTKVRGYHPLIASIAGTGDVVHSRLRSGNAHTAPGASRFIAETFDRVRAAGATGPFVLRADSGFYSHQVTDTCRRHDVTSSITAKLYKKLKGLITGIAEENWQPIPYFLDDGADVSEIAYTPFTNANTEQPPVRLIVRRVRPKPGSQLALFTVYDYHAFITNRDGDTIELEADHRHHAEIENTIRDLKHGVGLHHLPSAASEPTPPGSPSTSSPTTCHAGSAASGSAHPPSPTTRCVAATSPSPAASPAAPEPQHCTCQHDGRGAPASSPPSPTSTPSSSPPDHHPAGPAPPQTTTTR